MSKSIYVAGGWFDTEKEQVFKSVIQALKTNKSVDIFKTNGTTVK